MCVPDAIEGHVAQPHLPRHRVSVPTGRTARLRVEREVDDLVDYPLGDARLPARPRCVLQNPAQINGPRSGSSRESWS